MKRTQAAALVLVNWRGMFYTPFEFDRNVTTLEGANGAGKTTVMIGAYVVLLPDMTRLRFTNLGEHGATGGDKGIWGRLGEQGRPSYAYIDFRLPKGERLVAGVHLERRAEPTVESKPLLITDLGDDVKLEDVLLDRSVEQDDVPELGRLRELVARAGGRITIFPSAKEYFAALFDQGVTPLRLTTDEERTKFNEMLRTSMTGGISRALTSELRGFLLREETGLADTLVRMRGNLDACRKTRQQVQEARHTEREIHEVFEAGERMFAAAVHATRVRADEFAKKAEAARNESLEAEEACARLADEVHAVKQQHGEVFGKLEAAQDRRKEAQDLLARTQKAHAIAQRIAAHDAERTDVVARAAQARGEHDLALTARDGARRALSDAQDEQKRAVRGLADLEQGIEELTRKAALHKMVLERQREAQERLPGEDVGPETAARLVLRHEHQRDALDNELLLLDRKCRHAEQRSQDFSEVRSALERIVRHGVEAAAAHARARVALGELHRLDGQAKEREAIPRRLQDARVSAQRQQAARADAGKLSTPDEPLATEADVEAAVQRVEAALQSTEERGRVEAQAAKDAGRTRDEARKRIGELEELASRWRGVCAEALALASRFSREVKSRDDLEALRVELQGQRDELHRAYQTAEQERRDLHEEALRLEQMGGTFDGALIRARDLVEGELLAGRFEDVEMGEAAAMQALLGPLHEAILVEDVRAAAEALARTKDRPQTVWIVGKDAPLVLDDAGRPPGEILGSDALVPGALGLRLSRLPERPTLGRKARQRRIEEIRQQEWAQAARVERLQGDECALDSALKRTLQLLPDASILERPDPGMELAAAQEEEARASEAARLHEEAARAARVEAQRLVPRRDALRRLRNDASLLDARDFVAEAEELARRLKEAERAHAELARVAMDRKAVEERLEALREPPPTEEELAQLRIRKTGAEHERDDIGRLLLALRYIDENRAAFAWTDAEETLHGRSALVPSLKLQLDRAERAALAEEHHLKDAEKALAEALRALQAAESRVEVIDGLLAGERAELEETGVDDASAETLVRVERRVAELEELSKSLDVKERQLARQSAVVEERLKIAKDHADAARSKAEDEERAWRPTQERWERLQTLADERGLLAPVLSERFRAEFAKEGSIDLFTRASAQAAVLRERLHRSRDGAAITGELKPPAAGSDQTSGEGYLDAWMRVRDWLLRRVPSQIAEVAEPLEALGRLREHLARLEERLQRNEDDLRGDSSNVARNIETQVRKAHRGLLRLNQDLAQVRFGNIHGVCIRVGRVERMAQVLRALGEGPAQALLFQADMPIEEALDELFTRHGGGRSGGQRLLDYREYMELTVEVRRQTSPSWEQAHPTRMSTGEAIGIGAAIMMVVLAAWERDANLLRAKRSAGTLRLLFLDEATRLSSDSIDVLFELCQNLELQLLIAAPEVARTEGNTTYRLVRRVERGREEVQKTGRRTVRAARA